MSLQSFQNLRFPQPLQNLHFCHQKLPLSSVTPDTSSSSLETSETSSLSPVTPEPSSFSVASKLHLLNGVPQARDLRAQRRAQVLQPLNRVQGLDALAVRLVPDLVGPAQGLRSPAPAGRRA